MPAQVKCNHSIVAYEVVEQGCLQPSLVRLGESVNHNDRLTTSMLDVVDSNGATLRTFGAIPLLRFTR